MKGNYTELLKRAYSKLPRGAPERKRFEIPNARSNTIGMRTIVHNLKEIADALNRQPQHLLKFLAKEMATTGTLQGPKAVFQGKFRRETFKNLIGRYTENYVICPICKLPDTKIVREKRLYFLICDACGAKSSIRPV